MTHFGFTTFLFLLTGFLFFSCQNPSSEKKQVALPNTPETVAQEWIKAFYNDDFSKAVLLSSDVTRMMIDSVKKEMEPNAALIAFTISEMSCQTTLDSALCTYVYQEEADRFEEYVNLIKINGQWLVNESWDASSSTEQEFDMIREEVEKIMEEEMQK